MKLVYNKHNLSLTKNFRLVNKIEKLKNCINYYNNISIVFNMSIKINKVKLEINKNSGNISKIEESNQKEEDIMNFEDLFKFHSKLMYNYSNDIRNYYDNIIKLFNTESQKEQFDQILNLYTKNKLLYKIDDKYYRPSQLYNYNCYIILTCLIILAILYFSNPTKTNIAKVIDRINKYPRYTKAYIVDDNNKKANDLSVASAESISISDDNKFIIQNELFESFENTTITNTSKKIYLFNHHYRLIHKLDINKTEDFERILDSLRNKQVIYEEIINENEFIPKYIKLMSALKNINKLVLIISISKFFIPIFKIFPDLKVCIGIFYYISS